MHHEPPAALIQHVSPKNKVSNRVTSAFPPRQVCAHDQPYLTGASTSASKFTTGTRITRRSFLRFNKRQKASSPPVHSDPHAGLLVRWTAQPSLSSHELVPLPSLTSPTATRARTTYDAEPPPMLRASFLLVAVCLGLVLLHAPAASAQGNGNAEVQHDCTCQCCKAVRPRHRPSDSTLSSSSFLPPRRVTPVVSPRGLRWHRRRGGNVFASPIATPWGVGFFAAPVQNQKCALSDRSPR